MTLAELENAMKHLWAKSSPASGAPAQTLFRHSVEVVGQMAEFYKLYRPQWPLSDAPICLSRVLAYSVLVHDFGKIHTDFQEVLRRKKARFGNRHEILSLAFLDWINIPTVERPWIEGAVALHHRNLHSLTAANEPFYLGDLFGSAETSAGRLARGVDPQDAAFLYELLSHAKEIFLSAGWQHFDCYDLNAFGKLVWPTSAV